MNKQTDIKGVVKTGHQELIKKINRSLILETIRNCQPITRANIAKKLNLSKATVSSIVDELVQSKFIMEIGYGNSTAGGGRRGIELGFNAKSGYAVGVDVGGTKTLVVITDLDGQVEYKAKHKTPKSISGILEVIKQSIKSSSIKESAVIAMGIGFPGTVDIEQSKLIDAPSLGLSNLLLAGEFEHAFSFPVFINNDVNCAALGERWVGSGKGSNHLVFLSIGTGLGSAIISNGDLVYGHSYEAGEIGYFINAADLQQNKQNISGEFGVLENKISGTALSKYGVPPQDIFQSDPDNQPAAEVVKTFIQELSITIGNIVSLLNPEKVIIGGGVSESLPHLLSDIVANVQRLTPIRAQIELASLGNDAGALGAIAYALQAVQDQGQRRKSDLNLA